MFLPPRAIILRHPLVTTVIKESTLFRSSNASCLVPIKLGLLDFLSQGFSGWNSLPNRNPCATQEWDPTLNVAQNATFRMGNPSVIYKLQWFKDFMKRKASTSHDEAVIRQLRDDSEFAVEYLRAALEDDDEPGVLLIALRRIAEARGGIAKVAKAAGIERESLYRALSVRGNPRLSTLVAVTKAVGLRLTVEAAR